MPGIGEGGCFLPNGLIGKKHIIAFPKELLDQPDEEQIRTVLHETAHYALGHKSPFEDTDLDYDKQEREAWALVERWLREWKDQRPIQARGKRGE
jgi:hypothetical protein